MPPVHDVPKPAGLFVGLVTLDLVQRVGRLPGPDEKTVAVTADIAAGGPATNAAVAFAALGGLPTLLTALGNGPVATIAAHDLTRHGVTLVDAATTNHPGPPISAVTVVDRTGERSVVSRNAEEAAVKIPDRLPSMIDGLAVVLLDGHLPTLELAAAGAAHRSDVTVVLDGGSWKPSLPAALGHVDAAVCSADFAVPGCATVEQSAKALLAAGVPFVAFTAGPRPIRWWTENAHGAVAVPHVQVRDTLGAGDAFHGAFAFALADHADEVEALNFAAAVAAVRVQHAGPRAWLSDPRLFDLARGVTR